MREQLLQQLFQQLLRLIAVALLASLAAPHQQPLEQLKVLLVAGVRRRCRHRGDVGCDRLRRGTGSRRRRGHRLLGGLSRLSHVVRPVGGAVLLLHLVEEGEELSQEEGTRLGVTLAAKQIHAVCSGAAQRRVLAANQRRVEPLGDVRARHQRVEQTGLCAHTRVERLQQRYGGRRHLVQAGLGLVLQRSQLLGLLFLLAGAPVVELVLVGHLLHGAHV
mmetsp:Transcript_25772/g.64733  ORF Transcript_25772/g.64733 Transcript_25772/m.64733 type:complete len:219 (-) Transcript_25772:3272-3928(-)